MDDTFGRVPKCRGSWEPTTSRVTGGLTPHQSQNLLVMVLSPPGTLIYRLVFVLIDEKETGVWALSRKG